MPGERLVLDPEPDFDFAGKEIERDLLNAIVHCRVRETLAIVRKRLETGGVRFGARGAGLRFTGGCSMLRGIEKLAEEVFGIPVSRAHFADISTAASFFENPRLSCTLGLVNLEPETTARPSQFRPKQKKPNTHEISTRHPLPGK